MIPILTSLPPKLSRQEPGGAEIGPEYQEACIDSWKLNGFQVHSINSHREISLVPHYEGVTFWQVNRDANHVAGKHLVWLSDIMKIAAKVTNGPFLFVNADIILRSNSEFYSEIENIKPKEMLFSKRIDVDRVSDQTGTVYPWGYDLFCLHRDDIIGLEETKFIMGCPWWDYFVPYSLALRGVRLRIPSQHFAHHLRHHERWKPRLWTSLGLHFADQLRSMLDRREIEIDREVIEILRERPSGVRHMLRPGRTKRKKTFLKKLNKYVVQYLDSNI